MIHDVGFITRIQDGRKQWLSRLSSPNNEMHWASEPKTDYMYSRSVCEDLAKTERGLFFEECKIIRHARIAHASEADMIATEL